MKAEIKAAQTEMKAEMKAAQTRAERDVSEMKAA